MIIFLSGAGLEPTQMCVNSYKTCAFASSVAQTGLILLEYMHKKFEINRIKIKGGCQSGRQVVTYNSKSDLPLDKM